MKIMEESMSFYDLNKTGRVRASYNVELRRVRVTIIAVEEQ
jgi:hypothetical protein